MIRVCAYASVGKTEVVSDQDAKRGGIALLPELDRVEVSGGDEIVMTGRMGIQSVVVRIPRNELDQFLKEPFFGLTPRRKAAGVNLDAMESAVARKYAGGHFHPDCFDGRDVARVHLSLAEMLAERDSLVVKTHVTALPDADAA